MPVDYAYDCGSIGDSPQCKAEIAKYADGRLAPKLDVVYLSHFHDDHVNRVPDLAAAVDVRSFVIPLVPPAERLLVLAEAWADPDHPEPDNWYLDLIVDPAGTLRQLREGTVVVEVPPEAGWGHPESSEPPKRRKDQGEGLEVETRWNPPGADGVAWLRMMERPGVTRPLWLWLPYVLPAVGAQQNRFVEALARETETDFRALVKQLEDRRFLRDLVLNGRAPLTKAYKSVAKDLNLTSLFLYSGPAVTFGVGSNARAWRSRHGGVARMEVAAWDVRPGWFGTGDAPLNSTSRIDAVAKRYERYIANVGTLALPHHGSWKSLDPQFLDIFGALPPTCVVSAGSGNRYKHPSLETSDAVADRGFHLVRVTGDPRSRWTISATSWL